MIKWQGAVGGSLALLGFRLWAEVGLLLGWRERAASRPGLLGWPGAEQAEREVGASWAEGGGGGCLASCLSKKTEGRVFILFADF